MKNNVFYLVKEKQFGQLTNELPKKPYSGFVRVKLLYCSICGGDYSRFIGRRRTYPVSLGHEFVAEIIAIGEETNTELHVGELVTSDLNYRCGKCSACQNNMSYFCENLGIEKFSNRALADYADIYYSYLYSVHFNKAKAYLGALIEPLSCVIHALDRYDIKKKNNSILIFGVGGIGMLAAFYLQIVNGIKTDIYDINPKKMDNVQAAFGCGKISNHRYSLIIEATNSVSGLVSCIKHQLRPEICSFSHLYGENMDIIYESLAKQEAVIYFPLRNGESKNMLASHDAISDFWQPSFDHLISFYPKPDINKAFIEKSITNSSKQIICLEDISNKHPAY